MLTPRIRSRSAVPVLIAAAIVLCPASGGPALSQSEHGHDAAVEVRHHKQQLAFRRLGTIINELSDAQAQIRTAQNELRRANAIEQEAIKQVLKRDPAAAQLHDRVTFLELIAEQLIHDPRNIEPEVQAEMQRVAKELARARQELNTRREQLAPSVRRDSPQLQTKREAAQERIGRLREVEARLIAEWDDCIKEAFGLK